MSTLFSRIFLLLVLCGLLPHSEAQPFPNCFLNGAFTATGNGPGGITGGQPQFGVNLLDNTLSGAQCNNWVLTVWASTGVSAFSIQLEGSGAGTFTPVTVTANSGTNPITTLTGGVTTFQAMFNQFRLNLTSLTGSGTVNYRLIGAAGINPPGANAAAGTSNVAITSPIGQQAMATSVSVAIANNQTPVPTSNWPTTVDVNEGNPSASTPRFTQASMGTILSGQQAVTTSAVALATNTINNICVEALSTNTISVFIGPSGTTTATGLELKAGAAWCSSISNSNLVFVVASATGATVTWGATK